MPDLAADEGLILPRCDFDIRRHRHSNFAPAGIALEHPRFVTHAAFGIRQPTGEGHGFAARVASGSPTLRKIQSEYFHDRPQSVGGSLAAWKRPVERSNRPPHLRPWRFRPVDRPGEENPAGPPGDILLSADRHACALRASAGRRWSNSFARLVRGVVELQRAQSSRLGVRLAAWAPHRSWQPRSSRQHRDADRDDDFGNIRLSPDCGELLEVTLSCGSAARVIAITPWRICNRFRTLEFVWPNFKSLAARRLACWHDLFGKPVSTFPVHALTEQSGERAGYPARTVYSTANRKLF